MMEFDLVDRIVGYLADGGYKVSKKRFDQFTGKEGTYISLMPATITHRNFDRTRSIDQPFEIVVKRESEREAMEECEAIAYYLDDVIIPSANGSYQMVTTSIYTGPEEIDLQDSGFYACLVRHIAEILR